MKKILSGIMILVVLGLAFYCGYTNMGGLYRAKEPKSQILDSLYGQGLRLELRQQIISAKLDTIIFLHGINLDYTYYLEYKIDSLIKELVK